MQKRQNALRFKAWRFFLVHVSLNLLNVGVEKTVGLCQGCYHISYKWNIVQCFFVSIYHMTYLHLHV